ncbi:MAG: ABC transporter permease [Acidimicrobiales bacterium]|nr:ABC transporter permease [Actinomycetota bacterium]
MTTTATGHVAAEARPEAAEVADGSKLAWAARDTAALVKRNLLHYTRVPQLLVFTFVQPIMFVLLFRYVFGGTIQIPNVAYVDYLMPGIFGQIVVFGATSTAIGLAEDMGSGIIERFRSLPMVRLSVLAGRTGADFVRNTGVVVVMLIVGVAVGFRPKGGAIAIAAACLLVLAFAFALSWIMALVGLKVANAEAAQAVAFPMLFPLTFASAAFVPVNSMPGWLQVFAAHQPVTVVVNAARGLMLGPEVAADLERYGVFNTSTTGYVLQSVAWIVAILAVFVPLAVRQFNRS